MGARYTYAGVIMNIEEIHPSADIMYSELDRAMWVTKHCRYNAAYRLRRRHHLSIYSITILSIYVLSLTLFQKYGFLTEYRDVYELLSMLLAVFILVLSLLEGSRNYMLSSEKLFLCGNEIRDLLDELKKYSAKTECDIKGIEETSKKYSNVLRACGENHETIDRDFHKAQNVSDFKEMNLPWSVWYKIQFYFSLYWFYALLIVLPPLLFGASVYFLNNK
jgi:hypothetical protein